MRGEAAGGAPLVLRVEAYVWVGLGDGGGAEGLGEALGVIGAGKEGGERGEGVGTAEGLGEGDCVVVEEEIDAGF